MNESTQKTPGQTLFHKLGKVNEVGISLWEYLSPEVKVEWENAAQAVLFDHKLRITAKQLRLADGEAKDADRYWQDFADSLNALLSHKSPDGGEEEWEEARGWKANYAGWDRDECEVKLSSGTWAKCAERASNHKFVDGGIYRRPRQAKEESQPQGERAILRASQSTSNKRDMGSPVADSQPRGGQEMATPEKSKTIVQLCSEIAKQEGELNATKRERDEARAQLVEMEKDRDEMKIAARCNLNNFRYLAKDQKLKFKQIEELQSQLTTAKAEVERLKKCNDEFAENCVEWSNKSEKDRAEIKRLHVEFENCRVKIERLTMERDHSIAREMSLRQTQGGRLSPDVVVEEIIKGGIGIMSYEGMGNEGKSRWFQITERLNSHLTSPWTAITGPETLPKESDGDRNGEVLFERDNGVRIVDNYTANNPHYKFWMPVPPLPTPEPEQVEDDAQLGLVKRLCNEVDNLRVKLKNGEKEGAEGYQRRSVLNHDVQQWLAAQEKGKV